MHSDKNATYAGFARFPDYSSRDRFIKSTLEDSPKLQSCAYVSENQPTIIFENLTASQRDRIQSALKELGQWFEDVQFQTM